LLVGDGNVPAEDVHGGGEFGEAVRLAELEPGEGLLEGLQEGDDGDVIAQHAGFGVVGVAGVDVGVGDAVELAAFVLERRADARDHVEQGVVGVEAVGGGEELVVADQCAFADWDRCAIFEDVLERDEDLGDLHSGGGWWRCAVLMIAGKCGRKKEKKEKKKKKGKREQG
jgi:hypothetical protein